MKPVKQQIIPRVLQDRLEYADSDELRRASEAVVEAAICGGLEPEESQDPILFKQACAEVIFREPLLTSGLFPNRR